MGLLTCLALSQSCLLFACKSFELFPAWRIRRLTSDRRRKDSQHQSFANVTHWLCKIKHRSHANSAMWHQACPCRMMYRSFDEKGSCKNATIVFQDYDKKPYQIIYCPPRPVHRACEENREESKYSYMLALRIAVKFWSSRGGAAQISFNHDISRGSWHIRTGDCVPFDLHCITFKAMRCWLHPVNIRFRYGTIFRMRLDCSKRASIKVPNSSVRNMISAKCWIWNTAVKIVL
jgi:hypothetical protein